jgi:hypothetical protein
MNFPLYGQEARNSLYINFIWECSEMLCINSLPTLDVVIDALPIGNMLRVAKDQKPNPVSRRRPAWS